MDRILIVEDELIVARDIRKTLERNGYKVLDNVRTAEKALLQVQMERPSFVLLDIFLKGDMTGIDLAAHLNKENIPFIYVSANSNQHVLESAKLTNPYGFIVKPFREKDLLVTIEIAKYRFAHDKQIKAAMSSPGTETKAEGAVMRPVPVLSASSPARDIIGRSTDMLKVFSLIEQVAPFDTSVLILGESGTGKEGIANAVVRQSPRKDKPFIKINCAAIPAALMESELFGHEKGAFTGAADKKIGKFELASGGTILLDEIGDMPIDMQVKLLRVLQEKEIQRVGGATTIKTDVRIIAATSRNLEKEVAEGRFRLDLYYRLLVFPISLPALRQRADDIPMLADYFVRLYAQKANKNIRGIDGPSMKKLQSYHWPGNVRELQYLIERSVLLTQGDMITDISMPGLQVTSAQEIRENAGVQTLEEMERAHILAILKQSNFKIMGAGGAAELLNIPPTTLHSKMKKLGIKKKHE